jgi:hypothetical protein
MSHRNDYSKHRRTVAKRRGLLTPTPARTPGDNREHLNRYGLAQERRAVDVFTCADAPDWWLSIRRATDAEDRAGIDAWVTTDRGDVAVQIKSSTQRAVRWREEHPGIDAAIVVLHESMTDEQVRALVVRCVGIVRARMSDGERRAA